MDFVKLCHQEEDQRTSQSAPAALHGEGHGGGQRGWLAQRVPRTAAVLTVLREKPFEFYHKKPSLLGDDSYLPCGFQEGCTAVGVKDLIKPALRDILGGSCELRSLTRCCLSLLLTWELKALGRSLNFKFFLLIPVLDYPM